jgi:DNA-binding phage protein
MRKKVLVYGLLPAVGFSFLIANLAFANGGFGFGWFGGLSNTDPDQLATRQQNMFSYEAQILGISVDELKDAWAEGKSLSQIAKDKGITQEQIQQRIKQAMEDQMKAYLKTLVDKGVISQSQADKRLQFMQNQPSGNKGYGKGLGFHGLMK